MNEYIPTIGLEVHAELKTRTKMFCDSRNDPDEERPNVNVCPVCMAHPGTLPAINKEAVRHIVRMGVAVGGTIADYTEFDRKNYFYPDIPKGYQISQYEHPIVKGGMIGGVELTRIHLEEDTARSVHGGGKSLVDFNRAGVPLMELVTEPVIHSAEAAGVFARELQLILRYLGAGEANMEKGEMRVEANISVSKDGTLGTKVEIKNLNSFRSVERAIAYEIERQSKALEKGEKLVQETRGWDEGKQQTFSQRLKESSHDYRYFPDPDLPKLYLSEREELNPEQVKQNLPELPWERRERYLAFGLKKEDADMFVSELLFGDFYDGTCRALSSSEEKMLAANYVASDLAGRIAQGELSQATLNEAASVRFGKLVTLIGGKKLTSRAAKDMLVPVILGEDPESYAEREGLFQKSDMGEIEQVAKSIIDENPTVVADYRSGKMQALQFLVGKGMKATKGSANPELLKELFTKLLA
jgi:aspartyl-tRNA(Asn)/glutamyl-tRNA(Gln) amidotransferase subunit B